jgi:hypothetical protein
MDVNSEDSIHFHDFCGVLSFLFSGIDFMQSLQGLHHASYAFHEGSTIQKFFQLLRAVLEHQVTHVSLFFS